MGQSIYSDVWATCGLPLKGDGGGCIAKNDGIEAFSGTIKVASVHLTTGAQTIVYSSASFKIPAGPGAAVSFMPSDEWAKGLDGDHVFTAVVTSSAAAKGDLPECSHVILPDVPYKLNIAPTKLTTTVGALTTCTHASSGEQRACVPVNLVASPAPAIYVTLTTTEEGRFSENSVFVHEQSAATPASFSRQVYFYPFEGMEGARMFDLGAFKSSLRTEDVAMYMA
jgi:hypothetical protein